MTKLTAERARNLLEYGPDTGILRWRINNGRVRAGDIAGHQIDKGHIQIMVDGRRYSAHRVAHLIMTGEWPAGRLQHIDRDLANNRWSNLRPEATVQKTISSGHKGASWHPTVKKYRARIRIDGKQILLGWFTLPENASDAYAEAATMKRGGTYQ